MWVERLKRLVGRLGVAVKRLGRLVAVVLVVDSTGNTGNSKPSVAGTLELKIIIFYNQNYEPKTNKTTTE